MMPIVVTYPRTGSELITAMISNYAKQVWGSGDNLDEFLLVTFLRRFDYRIENGKITGSNPLLPKTEWLKINHATVFKEVDRRIDMLRQDPKHVFKLIMTPWMKQSQIRWCLTTYNPVFLERRDKVQSLLSFLLAIYIGMHHTGPHREVKPIKFDFPTAMLWNYDYLRYKELAADSTPLVMEDVIEDGIISERLVLETLGWDIPDGYSFLQPATIPTPYQKDLRQYFTNPNDIDVFIQQNAKIFRTTDGTPS